ncbi:MAG: acetoacetate--CoA ligase [Gammaproteobacteria bacterium]
MNDKALTAKPLWQPTQQDINNANLTAFIKFVEHNIQQSFNDYASFYQWSIDQSALFWEQIWQFFNIKVHTTYQQVLIPGKSINDAQWFPEAQLNFAENLLSKNNDDIAIIFRNECQQRSTITYRTLYLEVAKIAAGLKQLGIKTGDRVAGVLPNIPHTVIAMLATTSLGAVWSACSPDFGLSGILDRLGQIQPKVLFSVNGQYFHGKHHDVIAKIQQLLPQLPTVQQTVIIPYTEHAFDITEIPHGCYWQDFLNHAPTADTIDFVPVGFNDPLYILYSSGTTGVPKAIVHGVGRVLLQHLKELALHTDIKASDKFLYYTTCGWMMWNWLVSGLALGCTLVLYDGSPTYPRKEYLFDIISEEQIAIFGTSAKYISTLEKNHITPIKSHDLTALRCILSTGSPLLTENFHYVYQQIKPTVRLSSISGGTDIVSCFALGNPLLPVYMNELQCRGLGLRVEVYNEQGLAVSGEKGELVCTAPFPAMPIYFWNDADGDKYFKAYFAKFDNVWAHGDYAELTEHQGMIIYGRSDAVLNPGGVRIGTAEIYRQIETLDEILESVVIGQQWKEDERIILFVKLRDPLQLDADLTAKIKYLIRTQASPRHVPAKIIQVSDIPRTVSGKIVELAVRDVVHGRPVKNKSALANPEALDIFSKIMELQN